jgi:hypothetical protein
MVTCLSSGWAGREVESIQIHFCLTAYCCLVIFVGEPAIVKKISLKYFNTLIQL